MSLPNLTDEDLQKLAGFCFDEARASSAENDVEVAAWKKELLRLTNDPYDLESA